MNKRTRTLSSLAIAIIFALGLSADAFGAAKDDSRLDDNRDRFTVERLILDGRVSTDDERCDKDYNVITRCETITDQYDADCLEARLEKQAQKVNMIERKVRDGYARQIVAVDDPSCKSYDEPRIALERKTINREDLRPAEKLGDRRDKKDKVEWTFDVRSEFVG